MPEREPIDTAGLRKRDFTLPDQLIPIEASTGRFLAAAISGPENGKPVFYLHGSPGSRTGPVPRSIELHLMNSLLITYDRPGYGYSTRNKGRTVADDAYDVRAIADSMGIEKFAVVGRSGGGPGALACAALLPDRVTKVATLVSPAPKYGFGQWYEGMSEDNRKADPNDVEYIKRASDLVAKIQRKPDYLIREHLWDDLSEFDRQALANSALWHQLIESYREGLRQGPWGWIDDTIAKNKDWGFDFSDITVPVLLWHGSVDRFVPPTHLSRLQELIPHAIVELEQDRSHFSAHGAFLDVVLPWLIDKT